jgi:hypothetical protein
MTTANNTINPDVQKRRFALLLHAGYGERWTLMRNDSIDDYIFIQ